MNRDLDDLVPLGSDASGNRVDDLVHLVPLPKGRGEPSTKWNKSGDTPSRNQVTGTKSSQTSQQPTLKNVRGNSRDPRRGSACTPRWLALAVGEWDLDPFSNPRSHVVSARACWLERDDDGFGGKRSARGEYRWGEGQHIATETTRVWFQPDYRMTLRAFNHYAHTRWCALLRYDPRPEWFDEVHDRAELVCIPRGTYDEACRMQLSTVFNFELAPGIKASSNTFPHALYYRNAEDVTPAVLRTCITYRKKPRS